MVIDFGAWSHGYIVETMRLDSSMYWAGIVTSFIVKLNGSIYRCLFVFETALTWTVRDRERTNERGQCKGSWQLTNVFAEPDRPYTQTFSPFHHVNNFKLSVHKLCSKWDQLAQWISFGEYKKSPDKWRKTIHIHARTHSHIPQTPTNEIFGILSTAISTDTHRITHRPEWRSPRMYVSEGALRNASAGWASICVCVWKWSKRASLDQLAAYKFINDIIVYSNAVSGIIVGS